MAVGEVSRRAELSISPGIAGRVQAAAILSLTASHILVLATIGMEMVGASLSTAGGRFTPGFMVGATIEELTEVGGWGVSGPF